MYNVVSLTLCLRDNFACFLLCDDFFFQIQLFQKILQRIPSECQTVGPVLGSKPFVKVISKRHEQGHE